MSFEASWREIHAKSIEIDKKDIKLLLDDMLKTFKLTELDVL